MTPRVEILRAQASFEREENTLEAFCHGIDVFLPQKDDLARKSGKPTVPVIEVRRSDRLEYKPKHLRRKLTKLRETNPLLSAIEAGEIIQE